MLKNTCGMYLIINIIFCLDSFGNQINKDQCKHDPNTFRCVKFIKNYDGDTFTFVIPNVHPLLGKNISVRLRGVDTAEIRGKRLCEKQSAATAKALVNKILQSGKKINLKNIRRGKYFRIIADVHVDEVNLSTILLIHDLAYKYDGGRKSVTDWCKSKRVPATEK